MMSPRIRGGSKKITARQRSRGRGMSATYEDRYGLPLSARGREAAEHYMEEIDRALALGVDAPASLEAAVAADDDFAMAHIALAREFQYRGNITAAQASKSKALQCM